MPDALSPAALTLAVLGACTAGWTLSRLRESTVAVAGVTVLALTGVLSGDALLGAFFNHLTALLVVAFVVAGLLRDSGLAASAIARCLQSVGNFTQLSRRLVWLILATAFVVPSTTGRAVLLLPVFLLLTQAMPGARHAAALALLFPTTILLSACAALTGAAAHLVAVDFIAGRGGPTLGVVDWIAFGLPFAVCSCLVAERLILTRFLTTAERQAQVSVVAGLTSQLPATRGSQPGQPLGEPLKGVGARAISPLARSSRLLASALQAVEWRLVLFVGAALALGEAVVAGGVADWMGAMMQGRLPVPGAAARHLIIAAALLAALLSHLLIPSRSARVVVLIPAVAMPVAALGVDAAAIVLLLTMASGFCQLSPVGAKALPIFSGSFAGTDLRRLGWSLLAPMFIVSSIFAWGIWPMLGLRL